MHETETGTERNERMARLLAQLIRRIEAGDQPAPLRERLNLAIMMSPLADGAQASALAQFDAAVSRVEGAAPVR